MQSQWKGDWQKSLELLLKKGFRVAAGSRVLPRWHPPFEGERRRNKLAKLNYILQHSTKEESAGFVYQMGTVFCH